MQQNLDCWVDEKCEDYEEMVVAIPNNFAKYFGNKEQISRKTFQTVQNDRGPIGHHVPLHVIKGLRNGTNCR